MKTRGLTVLIRYCNLLLFPTILNGIIFTMKKKIKSRNNFILKLLILNILVIRLCLVYLQSPLLISI
ncbi:hypothetical protein Xentx_00696 [Xenorhabdus thuongxuanensis]|uniref:Uncharacterized protein n=1 Tax=Xenorhabdus thuongxuanensis TaxID=1873484 RepID=A0A1Q5U7P6_9GAMM|nr:hypothetical protein Xentx_00696 [Xenorhabdus thuongxuanensis]